MRTISFTALIVLSLTALALLGWDQFAHARSLAGVTGLALAGVSCSLNLLALRRHRNDAFRSMMSNYADRQMRAERPQPTFDAPSAVA